MTLHKLDSNTPFDSSRNTGLQQHSANAHVFGRRYIFKRRVSTLQCHNSTDIRVFTAIILFVDIKPKKNVKILILLKEKNPQ